MELGLSLMAVVVNGSVELTVREMSPLYEMMKEGIDINGHNTDWLIH